MLSFEHLLATICSVIIILVVTTLLTPNQKETNIITLFKHKSNLIKEYNLLRFTKNNINLFTNEFSEVNFNILNLLDKFKDTFRDIDDDISIFIELNSTFDDYVDTLNNIQKTMDDKNITYDLSLFINKTSSLFDWYIDIFEGKTTEFLF